MSFSYKYLPDIALADIAFEAQGETLTELFEACGHALTAVMVDSATLADALEMHFECEGETLEECLHAWLEELVYLKDTSGVLAKGFRIAIGKRHGANHTHLLTTLSGETIDRQRHALGQDVKAVTYHMFEVREEDGLFRARVVLDI
jgi:SHS2 domain-containing protein